MDLSNLDLAALLTYGGLAAATAAVMELVKRVWQPAPATLSRFGPLIAIVIGVVIGGGASLLQHVDIVPNIVLGIIVGLTSAGLYDGVRSALPNGSGG